MPRPTSTTSLKPLAVGNVVTAAIQLFRSHFKQYTKLTLQSYLWLLVPIYGWAKSLMISAMISRLAFGDLIGKPESEAEARAQLEEKKWEFLSLSILVGIISFFVVFVFYIILIVLVLIGVGFVAVVGQDNLVLIGFMIVLAVLGFFAFIATLTWFFSRLIITELPLAIETPMDVSNSIKRSWTLTKSYVLRLQGIVVVAFLITLPLQIITQTLAFAIQIFLAGFMDEDSGLFTLLSFLLGYIIGIGSGIFVVPFWQAVKAVIYYDVRSRSEGLGIEIHDRAI
ncbi:MAG: DUF975 domain-containing protein [Coleofasciculaceae cyanobacterium SM2_1_6]|nr:DUF975 domain-containing protein [Coleofasciculaceae cyanobacterium SM2_1_6]